MNVTWEVAAFPEPALHFLRSDHQRHFDLPRPYFIANGLTGDPTAPVIGIAGATNMNS